MLKAPHVTRNRVRTILTELWQSLWISRHHASSHYLCYRKSRNQLFIIFPVKLCLVKGLSWCSSKIHIYVHVYKLYFKWYKAFLFNFCEVPSVTSFVHVGEKAEEKGWSFYRGEVYRPSSLMQVFLKAPCCTFPVQTLDSLPILRICCALKVLWHLLILPAGLCRYCGSLMLCWAWSA